MIYTNDGHTQFHLTNGKISYIIQVMKNGQLAHLYYGRAIRHQNDFSFLQNYRIPMPYSCYPYDDDTGFSLDTLRQEFPGFGHSDFREPAYEMVNTDGHRLTTFVLQSYRIRDGKPPLDGLPATYVENDGEAQTIHFVFASRPAGLRLTLSYTLFSRLPVIARQAQLVNTGTRPVFVDRLMSASVDYPDKAYDMVQFSGAWARERHIKVRPLECGIQSISSIRGSSSHQQNPSIILKRRETTERSGDAYQFMLIYSGNFLAQAEVDQYDNTRVMIGIHPFQFNWRLDPGGRFQTPEALLIFSDRGLGQLTRSLHDVQRRHLIQPQWRQGIRPILINNWEATYFKFNEQKLLKIAEEAQKIGIELFVLDDGWFGKRNNDKTSLGDWWPNLEKLPGGLAQLSRKIRALGLKFGLWFELEMVSPKSELYRKHPDWAVGHPSVARTYGRHQFVLDMTRPEIVNYLFDRVAAIIREAQLAYIKWDMNRSLTDAFSLVTRQGEFYHRYVLGVYRLYDRLTRAFPNVLFESCAGGGGRVDAGLLYYAPQAWASDDTDPVERLKIQYGSSFIYPIYSLGSHISASPNHQTHRETPLALRAQVALFGTFGLELNPSRLGADERRLLKGYTDSYKNHRRLIAEGDFYRLISPFEHDGAAWMVVAKDRTEALIGYYQTLTRPNPPKMTFLKLMGLDAQADYRLDGWPHILGGDELMIVGLPLLKFDKQNRGMTTVPAGDFQSLIFHMKKCNDS